MDYSIESDGNRCTITMKGSFTFTDSSEVRRIIGGFPEQKGKEILVDLAGLESIDSAGLGMIILISDAAQDNSLSMRVSGANGQVRKMLEISNFSELMTID